MVYFRSVRQAPSGDAARFLPLSELAVDFLLRMPTRIVFALALTLPPSTMHAASYKLIQNFVCGANSECYPSGPLVLDQGGNLYGSAEGGGVNNYGNVFELSPNPDGTWYQTLLHSFDFHADGDGPRFGVVRDGQGDLFGTTLQAGGPRDLGTVYELTPDGSNWDLGLLYDGSANAAVILSKAGDVYGPIGEGVYLGGAIAELSPSPNGWTYTDLYSFCAQPPQCPDGQTPFSPLAFDARGSLYGTTLYGGNKPFCTVDTMGCGTAFQLSPNRDGPWTFHLMHAFAASADDGETPVGSLVVDRTGSLYGTTSYGGPNHNGTIFKLTPSAVGRNWVETELYTFPDCSGDGCQPYTGLVADKAGNLYGAAGGGNHTCLDGSACGVLFSLSPRRDGSWKYAVLYKFSGPDGDDPNQITIAPDGTIYGTTLYGGQNNQGVAFQITP